MPTCTNPVPVFVVQSDEFARIDYENSEVLIEATLMALHNYADHWQARLRIEFPVFRHVPGHGVDPNYQTCINEATDVDREVLARWLTIRTKAVLLACQE